MRYLIFCLLLAAQCVAAQSTLSPWQVGLSADLLLSATATVAPAAESTVAPLGLGRQFGLWTSYELHQNHHLRLDLAYRVLAGYQRRELEGRRVYTPTQMQDHLHTKELLALHYADAGLSWEGRWSRLPRWRIQLGGRLAYLAKVQGSERGDLMVRGLNVRQSETWTSISDRFVVDELYVNPLGRENYRRFDYGASLGILYELSRGLYARLGAYEGFENVLGDGDPHRVRSLSLGFQARLF